MEKSIRTTLAIIAIILSTNRCIAQNSKKDATSVKENTLLWEISGNGIAKPSYLYGTLHIICENDFFIKEKVNKAFNKTSILALEMDLSDTLEMKYIQKSAMGTILLSKKLSVSQAKELNEILEKTANMTLKQVDNYAMATVMSLIAIKSFDCPNLKSYEMEFVAKATEANKKIIGMEKAKEQIDLLNIAYTDEEIITVLGEMNQELTKKMVEDYKSENIKNIYSSLTDTKMMNKKTKSFLLDNRNIEWASKMPELMEKESVFFAVGAGHLLGENGLIKLLNIIWFI